MLFIEDMIKEDVGNYFFIFLVLGLLISGRVFVYSECNFYSFICILLSEVGNFNE